MSSKRRRDPTFAEMVQQVPKVSDHPRDGQSRNRGIDEGAWDPQGRFWERPERSAEWLSREDVERLLADGALLLCPSYGDLGGWYSNADGRVFWRDVLSKRFVEDNSIAEFEEAGWPVEAVYSAKLCTRPDGAQLIWLEEHC